MFTYWSFCKFQIEIFVISVLLNICYEKKEMVINTWLVTYKCFINSSPAAQNPCARFLLCCLKCCFWCLEKFIKFLNRNAYIMVSSAAEPMLRLLNCFRFVLNTQLVLMTYSNSKAVPLEFFILSIYWTVSVLFNLTSNTLLLVRLPFMGKTSAFQQKMLSCFSWET